MILSECHLVRDLKITDWKPLNGGRNNSVSLTRSRSRSEPLVIKQFAKDRKDRFDREVLFLEHCRSINARQVPKIVNFCLEHFVIAMTFEQGISPGKLTKRHENQVFEFIRLLQEPVERNPKFLPAIEPVWTVQHLDQTIRERISRLSLIVKILPGGGRFMNFLPTFRRYVDSTAYGEDLENLTLPIRQSSKLKGEDRGFFSPSDLGMHNCLERNGKLIFLDFEYAGFDSGLNLVGDLIMQPDSQWAGGPPISLGRRIFREFFDLDLPEVNLITRVFGLRWALISLIGSTRPKHTNGLQGPHESDDYISRVYETIQRRI